MRFVLKINQWELQVVLASFCATRHISQSEIQHYHPLAFWMRRAASPKDNAACHRVGFVEGKSVLFPFNYYFRNCN